MRKIIGLLLLCVIVSGLSARRSYWTRKGEEAYAKVNYDKALKYFQKAIEAGDESGEPYFFTGIIYETRKNYAESVRWFSLAIERPLRKKFKIAALWKILIYYKHNKNYEKVLETIDLMEEKFRIKNKKLEKLREEAEANASPEKREARELYRRAITMKNQGESIDSYLPLLERARLLNPEGISILWHLASAYEKKKDYASALQTYRSIEEATGDTKATYKTGIILKRQGAYKDALQILHKILKDKTLSARIRYYAHLNAAQAHYALGEFADSMEHARIAENLLGSNARKKPARLLYCLALLPPERPNNLSNRLTIYKKKCEIQSPIKGGITLFIQAHYRYYANKPLDDLIPHIETLFSKDKANSIAPWLSPDLLFLAARLYSENKHELLCQGLRKYETLLNPSEQYPLLRAECEFKTEQYAAAADFYARVKDRSWINEKNYLLALYKSGQNLEFKEEIRSYWTLHPDKKEMVIAWLKNAPETEKLREQEWFEEWVESEFQ